MKSLRFFILQKLLQVTTFVCPFCSLALFIFRVKLHLKHNLLVIKLVIYLKWVSYKEKKKSLTNYVIYWFIHLLTYYHQILFVTYFTWFQLFKNLTKNMMYIHLRTNNICYSFLYTLTLMMRTKIMYLYNCCDMVFKRQDKIFGWIWLICAVSYRLHCACILAKDSEYIVVNKNLKIIFRQQSVM